MDDEEDDFYDPADTVPAQAQNSAHDTGQPQDNHEMDEEEEVEEEDDEVRVHRRASGASANPLPRMISTLSQRPLPMRRLQKCK